MTSDDSPPRGFDIDVFDSHGPDRLQVEVQHGRLDLPVDRCRSLLEHVLQEEKARVSRLTLILADHATVLDLNRRYLGHDFYTDVLAFDYSDENDRIEGEIYVDLDTALERCSEFDAAFEVEALRYAVHGLLHLIGYSDETPSGKEEMEALEDRYLRSLTR